MKTNLRKCCTCGKTATWLNINPQAMEGTYYCDECVPKRGAIFNVEDWGEPQTKNVLWWDKNATINTCTLRSASAIRTKDSLLYAYIEPSGTIKPSIKDFMKREKGFIKEDKQFFISYISFKQSYNKCMERHNFNTMEGVKILNDLIRLFIDSKETDNAKFVNYTLFMSKVGDYVNSAVYTNDFNGKEMQVMQFYRFFKKELNSKKVCL